MTRWKGQWAPVVAAAGALVAALSGAWFPAATAADEGADGLADWTMMVYAVGDTDGVADLMVQNLNQMAALPDDADVNVVVLLDLPDRSTGQAPTSTLPGLGEFSTAKLLVLAGNRYNEVRDLGEIAMGRPDVLASFIEEAAGRFPAEKYGLTLFDHGGAHTGGYIDIGPPSQSDMIIPEIREGMAAGMARAGIDRFEVLFHAACLMSNYETTSALAPLAKVMAGSEEIMFRYPMSIQGLMPLQENGSGSDVANGFVDGYGALLDTVAAEGEKDLRALMAMSVVDGDGAARLDAAMKSFSEVAVAHMDEIAPDVARARHEALEFADPFGYSYFSVVDLGDFLRHLDNLPPDVAVARDAAFAALEGAVTYQLTGQGTEQSTGLNVFLPTDPGLVRDYLTDGTAPQGWGAFVRAFLEASAAAGDGSGPAVEFVGDDATVVQADAEGFKANGQLVSGAAAEVTTATTTVLTQMGERENAVAVVLPAFLNAGGEGVVQGVWDYGRTVLTDGTKTIPVSTVYQAQSGGLLGSFEAQYTDPNGVVADLIFRVLLSSEGEVQAVTLAEVRTTAAAGTLLDSGVVRPYIYYDSSGQQVREPSSQSIQWSELFEVDFVRMPAGADFTMRLAAGDLGGTSDSVEVRDTVR